MNFPAVFRMGVRGTILALPYLLAACGGKVSEADPRPSFVVFYTDDHGFADLGIQGVNDDVRTPNIDALAQAGVLATEGYVSAPQCAPSRAGLLTGIHQNRFGLDSNRDGPLAPEQITIAERLKAHGYVTAMVGKWHLSKDSENAGNIPPGTDPAVYYPANQGFDEYFEGYATSYLASHDAEGHAVANAPATVRDARYRVDVATQWAVSFIRRHQENPFFLYVPYYAPHVPLEAPAVYTDRFGHVSDEKRKLGLAMISAIDDGVGRIRAEIERAGLRERVLILLIGDNGAPLGNPLSDPPRPEWNGSLNDPLVGEKGMLTDGGIKVPFVAAWPGHIPSGQVYQRPISSLDVAPTLLAAAGIKHPEELDGVDLLPHFRGQRDSDPHEALYWRWGSQAAIRSGQWKLILLGGDRRYLFDMTRLAPEAHDLSADHPEIVNALRDNLESWAAALKRPGLPAGQPTPHDRTRYQRHGLLPS